MPKQILLADDSATIAKIVQITFAHEDYVVTAVKTGDEALQRARSQQPDLVLIDAGLPGKTGYDICAELREAGIKDVPILILTGHFSPYDEARGQRVGADGGVIKPFETQSLIDRVGQIIAQRGSRSAEKSGPATTPSIPVSRPTTLGIPVVPVPTAAPSPAAVAAAAAQSQQSKKEMDWGEVTNVEGSPPIAEPMAPPPKLTPPVVTSVPPVAPPKVEAPPVRTTPPAPPPKVEPPRPSIPPAMAGRASTAAPRATLMGIPTVPLIDPHAPVQTPLQAAKAGIPVPTSKAPLAGAGDRTLVTMQAPTLPVGTPPAATTPPKLTPPVVTAVAPASNSSPTLNMTAPATTAPAVTTPPLSTPPKLTPAVVPAVTAKAPVSGRVVEPAPATVSKGIPMGAPKMPRASMIPNVAAPGGRGAATAPSSVHDAPTAPTPRITPPVITVVPPEAVPPVFEAKPQDRMPSMAPIVAQVVGRLTTEAGSRGPEYEAIAKLSREVIEQIVWEVVPDLAESIIRAELDRLVKERQQS